MRARMAAVRRQIRDRDHAAAQNILKTDSTRHDSSTGRAER